ncbi:peroxiredoxin family protein [Halobacteria archaeon AArc-m2/3/4]|uniref:Peroxiredoxin family protein n=1 Tax=Natronoglomus mannanivorans TaxID=2979990 RepID=A0AAP2Z013_9EURY|nr:peroxiredoxin family protein [Halobacteria archaeon AArc-xg1-1]MCU4971964.1 peroxiredoxin family protein [Halobacteria archaeon AArc-m2/3/4]
MTLETRALDVTLANVGPGPDPLRLGELADAVAPADPQTTDEPDPAHESVVVLLHRDHHCGKCRRQIRAVADRYDEFRDHGAEVVSIVPEPRGKAQEWQDAYDLPFPLCADPEKTVGERFGQPVRFGLLGQFSDLVGRMPAAIVLDVRDPDEIRIAHAHRGDSTLDRPEVDDLLEAVAGLE